MTILVTGLAAVAAGAAEPAKDVPMYDKGLSTYYVAGRIDGYGEAEFMVDTGSAYVVLTEQTLKVLMARGEARYLRDLSGVMADGSRTTVPVFLIRSIHIGGDCVIRDVEAAVLPNANRNILGLSALRKAAPFTVALEPPRLTLSHCQA
jgi:predicted aspartyl protease